MSNFHIFIKRFVDLFLSAIALLVSCLFLVLAITIISITTKKFGLYSSTRIGKYGHPFTMWKIKTMKTHPSINTTITTINDPRITKFGRLLRHTKLDELPQLWNVLKGDMSLVGPRPDVPGFADQLQGEDRIILTVRPGVTGLATLAFRNEEKLLANQKNPERYNQKVIWPEKVRLNKLYIEKYSLFLDFKILFKTLFGESVSI